MERTFTRHIVAVLVAIFGIFALQGLAFGVVPLIANEGGVPSTLVGVLIAIPSLIQLLSDPPIGSVSDAIGRRVVIGVGAAVALGATAGLLVANAFWPLAVVMTLFALSTSLSLGPALALTTESSEPANQPQIQGYNGAVQGIAAVAAAGLIGWASSDTDPEGPLVAGIALAALVLSSVLAMKSDRRSGGRVVGRKLLASYRHAFRLFVANRGLQVSSLVGILHSFVFVVVGTAFIPLYAVEELGASATFLATLLVIRSLVAALVSLSYGRLSRLFGISTTAIMSGIAATVSVVFLPVAGRSTLAILALMVVQGAGGGLAVATSNVFILRATSTAERALGFVAAGTVLKLVLFVLPVVLGLTLEASGFTALFLLSGGLLASGTVLLGLLLRTPRRLR